jgi:indolepyruvate decarboxylase
MGHRALEAKTRIDVQDRILLEVGYEDQVAEALAAIERPSSAAVVAGIKESLNGVMGAKAERSLVFHVVGMPSYQHQRVHKITHHTLGDGVFGNFVDLSADAASCHAVVKSPWIAAFGQRACGERSRSPLWCSRALTST